MALSQKATATALGAGSRRGVRALVQRHLLALEIGHRLDRAVLGNQNGLAARGGRLMRDIEKRRTGGLGKDRRRFAGIAEIDRADIDGFEELRPGGKFRPGHLEAERLQLFLQRAPALEQDQLAIFLKADADGFILRRSGCGGKAEGKCRHGEGAGKPSEKWFHGECSCAVSDGRRNSGRSPRA